MTNRKRIGALLLCVGMVLALFVSSAYIAHEAGHDCSGEDCPICQMIAVNVNLLRTLGLAVLLLVALFVLSRRGLTHQILHRLALPTSGTLVSWKIRLND